MSYLRADDSFDANPKILALKNDQKRWTWLRILLYTTRYGRAEIPPNIRETVPKATPQFLRDCVTVGLIDKDEKSGTMRVHDWDEYNGVVAEKRERWKENKRTQRGQQGDTTQTNRGRESDSRAGVPHPLPLSTNSLSQQDQPRQSERERANEEEDRRQAWLERSSRPDIRSPQAFVAAGVRSGSWPDPYVAAENGKARATENGSGSGPAYIAGLIRNGVLTSLEDLEVELDLAGLDGDDRAVLVAQLERAKFMEVVE